ncbi:uncharacterized protein [Procambarus clarkii]|uniref:uncharacterized protein n=1 Tax=Procambarus clarkii TaxID=6728 RepID=UPI0037443338
MGVSAGGGSLRDVLLGGRGGTSSRGGGRGTSSRGTTRGTGLTWRSLRSVSGTTDAVDPQGHFFPSKLALSLALLKLLLATLMVALGAAALILRAALSALGGGLWAGAVVGLCGFLGVCASRRPYAHVYVVSFMCVAILSMASSGLLIVLSATAWARDDQHPTAVFVEQETQEEVEVLGEVAVRRPAVLVSGALVLLGVVDCIVNLACVAVSAREACGLYSKGQDHAQGLSEGHNRKERLYRWLGQQKTIFPIGSSSSPPHQVSSISQFVPLSSSDSSSSATPRKPSTDPSSTLYHIHNQTGNATPSHLSSSVKACANNTTTPSPSIPSILKPPPPALPVTNASHSRPQSSNLHASTRHQQLLYPHPLHPCHHYQHPLLHHIPQPVTHHYTPHPSLYYPHLITPMMPLYPLAKEHKKKDAKKRKDKNAKKDKKHSRKNNELTDEQIDKTYTGLDREIAEEFIDSTMEPGISIHRAINNSFEQDSF